MDDKPAAGSSKSEAWVMLIEDGIEEEINWFARSDGVEERRKTCTIFRVSKRVRDLAGDKGSIYSPDGISLGLFHRPGKYDAPKRGQKFKLKMASAFLATIYMSEDRRKESLARLQRNPAFVRRISHSDGRPRVECKDAKFSSKTDISGESRGECESLRIVSLGLRDHIWREVCENVVAKPDLELTKQVYNLQDEDRVHDYESVEVLQCALTLDAIALVAGLGVMFLGRGHHMFPFPLFSDHLEHEGDHDKSVVLKFMLDFLKLENQIPLHLLRNVMRALYDDNPTGGDAALNAMCAKLAVDVCQRFIPGYDDAVTNPLIIRLEEKQLFLKCDHLLDCVSLVLRVDFDGESVDQRILETSDSISRKLRRWVAKCIGLLIHCFSRAFRKDEEQRPSGRMMRHLRNWYRKAREPSNSETVSNRYFNIPSASRLQAAGVEFRHLTRGVTSDLLPVFSPGWLKATLYIPRLPRFSILTMTVWKNLLVYESRKVQTHLKSESQLLAFMAFMDSLIDTKEDVLLMTQGDDPVLPDRYSSAPEDLARMFNTVLSSFPVPNYQRWVALKLQIIKFQKQKYRRLVLDFVRANFGKPWLIISVTAATILLVLTFLQTIYAMLSYYP